MRHTYTYKPPKDNWFWLAAAAFNISFTIYMLPKVLQAEKNILVAFLLPIIFGLLGIVLFRVCFLRRQYEQLDRNKVLTIDTTSREMLLNESGKETIVKKGDIKDVEIFDSWNSNPLFVSLGYVKFNLLNGDNIKVTRFTADDSHLHALISGKPIKRNTRLMNPIK